MITLVNNIEKDPNARKVVDLKIGETFLLEGNLLILVDPDPVGIILGGERHGEAVEFGSFGDYADTALVTVVDCEVAITLPVAKSESKKKRKR